MGQLSEQTADLSVHAQKAENTVAVAQKKTHDKIVSRWEQVRADATGTIENVNQQIQSVGESIARVAADVLLREEPEEDEEEEDGDDHEGDEEDDDEDEGYSE